MNACLVSVLVSVNVLVNVTGTFLLKQSAVTGNPIMGLLGAVCYVSGAAIFVGLLKDHTLSAMAVVTSVLGLVAATLIGVHVYHETLSPIRWAGIALALASVVLISIPIKPG